MAHRLDSSRATAFSPPPAIPPFTREVSSLLGSFFVAGKPAPAMGPSRLLDLPLELLELVLFWAIKARYVQRGLRLRLVCKTFDIAFYPALFQTRLLDEYHGIGTLSWRIDTQQPNAELMWHKYLVIRTMVEKNPDIGRYYELRVVAGVCHRQMKEEAEVGVSVPELREVVEQLCWFLLRQGVYIHPAASRRMAHFGPNDNDTRDIFADGTRLRPRSLTLLSAAAFLNLHSVAQWMLDDGHNPEDHGLLLAPAMQAAAQAGNTAMLERLRPYQQPRYLGPFWGRINPTSCYGNWSLIGAAIRGDMDVLRNVMAHEMAYMIHIMWLTASSLINRDVTERQYASTPAIYDHITDSFPSDCHPMYCRQRELEMYAELGNLGMVRHLLDLGQSTPQGCQNALLSACRGSQIGVVSLLIQRGVDPQSIDLHGSATTTHDLEITRLLLRLGAKPDLREVPTKFWRFPADNLHDIHQSDDNDDVANAGWVRAYQAHGNSSNNRLVLNEWERVPVIVCAFYRENVKLLRLLIRYGATIPRRQQERLARELDNYGYDTMLVLLSRMCHL